VGEAEAGLTIVVEEGEGEAEVAVLRKDYRRQAVADGIHFHFLARFPILIGKARSPPAGF
jgi:hypothetical protein